MRHETELNYIQRIERVRNYIYDHLDEDLNFENISDVACFSHFHLHRIYRYLSGETIAQTVRRLRMHRAAGELIRTSSDIKKISKRAGYSSIEAFSRAFGSAYGEPPLSYRNRTQEPPLTHPIETKERQMFDVKIQNLDALRLAAISHIGDYMDIGKKFETVAMWAGQKGLLQEAPCMIGVYYDDPSAKPLADLRSEAGIVIKDDIEQEVLIDGSLVRSLEIVGGRYAVLRFKGPYAELEKAYSWLFGPWLADSGEEAADAAAFEKYLNDPKSTPPSELLTDICLPLK